jgi:hypothetical protein
VKINNCNHHRQVQFTIKNNHERHEIALRLATWLFSLVLTTDIQQITCRRMCVCVCACTCVCVHVRACVRQWLQASTTLIGRKCLQFLPKCISFCLLCYRIGRKRQTTVFSISNHHHPSTQQHPSLRSSTRREQFAFSYCWNAGGWGEDERGVGLLLVGVSSEMVLLCPFCFTRSARLCCNPHNSHCVPQTVFSKCLW